MSEAARQLADPRARVAAIVIGRDEGATLGNCLDQCLAQCGSLVYVDSGSADDSVDQASARGGQVVELGVLDPFLPGLARNCGFHRAEEVDPDAEFLQFVDGDCVLEPGWVTSAIEAMDANPELSLVFGGLREIDAHASPWKRMCEIEFAGSPGPAAWSGGIFLVRREVFRAFGGFRQDMVAGEEPELCTRIRARGGHVERIGVPMARHESHMHHFSQWWRREYRGGLMDFGVRTPDGSQPFARERFQTYAWTLGWLALCVVLALAGALLSGGAGAWLGALIGASVIPLQMLRQALWCRRQGHDWISSLVYGVLVVLLNWPKLLGQLRFHSTRCVASPS